MKTAQDVLTGLRAVVAGREDYVYESPDPSGEVCVYSTPTGEPSCGVGAYFFANDKDLFDEIHKAEWAESDAGEPMVNCSLGVEVSTLVRQGRLTDYTPDAVDLLTEFQFQQDGRERWGVALSRTEVRAKRLAAL